MSTPTGRIPKNYKRPPIVADHIQRATDGFCRGYEECATLLDSLIFDLKRTRYGYLVVADRHGPLYHVEIMDMIGKLDAILKKVEQDA